MVMKSGRRWVATLLLAAAALTQAGTLLWAQAPVPAPAAQPAGFPEPSLSASKATPATSTPSKVFPEGGFPDYLPSPERPLPAPAGRSEPPLPDPAVHTPISDYGPYGGEPREPGDAPGVPEYRRLFLPPSPRLPAYYYREEYYEQPIVGPHSIIEYAPPGYEARDQQVTPGTPEFTLITPPTPVTDEERQKFVTRGIFPGSFLVPGTSTSFRLRGFVRLQGFYDFDPIGSRDFFVPNTIPVPQQVGQNFNWSARMSRIAFETWTPTPFHEWTLHTYIEGDFFNGPGQAAGGGGNPFRLRHAFIDYGWFRLGQQNTVFMDPTSWPSLVDFQGPAGWVNQRRPGARATLPLADTLFWATGVEQPFSDITTNGQGTGVQDVPDFATHLRYETDYGHAQLSALGRAIGYRPTFGSVTRRFGGGGSASAVFHPWALLTASNPVRQANPSGLTRSRILLQYTAGWGIARYVNDMVGLGLDGQVDPATGAFDLPFAVAWNASYEHWFSERWLTNVTYSADHTASVPGQPGNTYVGAKYLAASLWFIPVRNLSLGVEYLWGQRDNLSTQQGRADRVNALVQYNF